jgi:hypothetical protein
MKDLDTIILKMSDLTIEMNKLLCNFETKSHDELTTYIKAIRDFHQVISDLVYVNEELNNG